MYIKRNYGLKMTFLWSKKPFIIGFLYAAALHAGMFLLNFEVILPWQPISILGIAVAFYLGFKNNSSYDRTWEARKIWGGIVNSSRSFGAATVSFVQGPNEEKIKKELIYRHIAWLIALRHQLRMSRTWEHKNVRVQHLFPENYCAEYESRLKSEMDHFLVKEDQQKVISSSNHATQIIVLQSKRLQELRNDGYFDDFRHMEFHKHITSFYTDQGKAERIKNFPFPRQYASTALWLTFVFAALVPLGMGDIFKDYGDFMYIISPLFSALIIWVFFLMEMIGDYSENPFEGTYNDVPITSIARGIEIDLREMIKDSNIPEPEKPVNGFLM
jgi:putative membrane protein